ncbi:MAG TPA: methyltransferase [Desulfomonilia bacterium]|nr:methyltransferase [Desulfomonilia bacterium]
MKGELKPRKDETLEVLSGCNLSILQKKKGYRYSLDAYLLGAFVEEAPGTEVLEIGSGCGVVSLLLGAMKGLRITGVEIQDDMADMSRRSIEYANLSDKIRISCGDIREHTGPKVDVIVTNPPYRPLAAGRINPDRSKAMARHEIALDLDTLLMKSNQLLRPLGRFYIVYPVWRIPDLICAMRSHRIEPKRMRFVYTSAAGSSEICLMCGILGGGREFTLESPLMIFNEDGTYHREMEMVFQGQTLQKKPLT